jgi:hypothetical protein
MDGVLVAVKDEIDCLPYPTTGKRRQHVDQRYILLISPRLAELK